MTQTYQRISTIPAALKRAATTDRGITIVDRDLAEQRVPWSDLAAAASRVAAELRSQGIEPGDRVGILGPTTSQLLVVLFGTWEAGAVPVVLSLPRRLSEIDAFVADVVGRCEKAETKVLAVSNLLLEEAPPIQTTARVVSLEELASAEGSPEETPLGDPSDLAYLQFTSGTTARSRAVPLTHRNLIANLESAGEMVGISPDRDVFVSWLPLFHDMGLIGMLIGSLIYATDLVLIPTEEFLGRPGVWIDAMSRYRGTITASPNFGYGLAARDLTSKPRALDLTSWRIAANGAEAIDIETCEKFCNAASAYGFQPNAMAPMFGLAEGTLAVTLSSTEEPVHVEWVNRDSLDKDGKAVVVEADADRSRALVACGYAIPGHDVVIKDENGEDLAPGRVGEICFRGPSVMQGYWHNDKATTEVLRDGWLYTGDLGYWSDHGLVVCGRKKDMIILGGRNLYPEDYELHTERVPGVRRGNVIAFAIPNLERMVVVAETTAVAAEADGVARLALEELRRLLPRGPEEVVLVSPGTLPKTSSGKRQRGACREQYASGTLEQVAIARR
jgi:fatty-acyl-CoA synthase